MSKSKNSDSLVWQFFIVCDDPCKAKYKCGKVYTRGRTPKTYSTNHFYRKKRATCDCNSAGSRIKKKGFFSRSEVDQAELLLVQFVAAALTETIKKTSQKRKESSMEGSDEEAADRKYQNTDSGSA